MTSMQRDVVIKLDAVSKKFSLTVDATRKQLKTVLVDSFLKRNSLQVLEENEFWALDKVSFEVERNERLAIIGHNGSGKSTLLKMLTGVYLPDIGSIEVVGNVGSILELSTGFKPELSGRQNIYLKFMLFRKNRATVDALLDDVIEFSELGKFIDTPLRNYSSGMKARLGFAIAVNMQPEVLILDEVFAAGDRRFRVKSEKKIKELYSQNTTILVTHSMSIVREVADKVGVLHNGRIEYFGDDITEGISFYEKITS